MCVISARPYGHRAVLKYAANTGAQAIAGRFTPGNFTNYITRSFKEPRLIIVTDPRVDHQAIREASYVNIPVIALCDTDSPLNFVDLAIPTNNKSKHSIGLIWWMLAREVLRLRGTIPRTADGWSVMVDMFFYRDPEEVERDLEGVAAAKALAAAGGAEAEAEVAQPDFEISGAPAGIANAGFSADAGSSLLPTLSLSLLRSSPPLSRHDHSLNLSHTIGPQQVSTGLLRERRRPTGLLSRLHPLRPVPPSDGNLPFGGIQNPIGTTIPLFLFRDSFSPRLTATDRKKEDNYTADHALRCGYPSTTLSISHWSSCISAE